MGSHCLISHTTIQQFSRDLEAEMLDEGAWEMIEVGGSDGNMTWLTYWTSTTKRISEADCTPSTVCSWRMMMGLTLCRRPSFHHRAWTSSIDYSMAV